MKAFKPQSPCDMQTPSEFCQPVDLFHENLRAPSLLKRREAIPLQEVPHHTSPRGAMQSLSKRREAIPPREVPREVSASCICVAVTFGLVPPYLSNAYSRKAFPKR